MTNTAKKISEFEKLAGSKRAGADDQSTYWFVARGSVLKGPFSPGELNQKLESKEITSFDYGWRQGFQEWRPLGSIVEINQGKPDTDFGGYPNIPVPGHGAHSQREKHEESTAQHLTPKKRKDVEVRLRHSTRHFFNPRYSAFTVVFALFVSYVTNQWSQNQIYHSVSTFFQARMAGKKLSLGEHTVGAPQPEVWTPLYSAPGYDEVKANLKLPVRAFGMPQSNAKNLLLNGQKVDVQYSMVEDQVNFSELDPIYVRPLEISGHLNPKRPQNLRVKQLGEPFLESFWEN